MDFDDFFTFDFTEVNCIDKCMKKESWEVEKVFSKIRNCCNPILKEKSKKSRFGAKNSFFFDFF